MRVTVITPYLPHGRIGHGGGVSIRNMIAYLARDHAVTVVSLVRGGEDELLAPTARDLSVEIKGIPFTDNQTRGLRRLGLYGSRAASILAAYRTGRPVYVSKYGSSALSRALVSAVEASRPDAVQIEYLQMGLIMRDLRIWRDGRRASGRPAPALFSSTHELGSLPRLRRLHETSNPVSRGFLKREISAWRRLERDVTVWADRTFCVTDQDRDLLQAGGGVNCLTLPLGVDTEGVQAVWDGADSRELLFVGSFAHRPNRLAAARLLDEIWPGVAASSGSLSLTLAGPGSREFLAGKGGERNGVRAVGFVPDLADLYRRCRLLLAPLPEGGGIKIKILEAMAAGIPIVTTPVGAEGIVTEGDDAMRIAAPDAGFADAVLEALRDRETAVRQSRNARRIIEDKVSWKAITARLASEYAQFQGR